MDAETTTSFTDATNHDAMMTLGRVLMYELQQVEAGWKPDGRASNGILEPDGEPKARLVLTSSNGRSWITPDAMDVLSKFGISVEHVKEENWDYATTPELRLRIPDEVVSAYERAAEDLGVPPAPRTWGKSQSRIWHHGYVMRDYGEEE